MPKAGEVGGASGVDGMLDTDADDAAQRETTARAQAGEWSIEDHFSLGIPSSSFRYRSTNLRVIKVGATQLILQQRKDGLPMLAKKASGATFGERFLKIVYVVVAFLLTGFIFVCSLAVILFLFLNILVNFGASSSVPSTLSFGLLGLLSLPVFLQALSTGVSLCFGLVQDIWDDFEYLHLLGKVDTVAAEWLVFIIFAMAPSLTAAICLFKGDEDWWRITGLVWFFGMLFFYALYAISITWYEFWESLSLVRALETGPKDKKSSYSKLLFEAILIRQRFKLNATRRRMFLESEDTTRAEPQYESLKLGCLSRVNCMYKKLNRPRPLYSISESLDAVPFYTASNWSLHHIFCSPLDNRKAVVLMSGQGSLSNAQLRSSFLCTVITFVLMWTMLVATLLYFEAPRGVIVMATIVTALLCLPRIWVELLSVVRRSPWCKSRLSRPLAQRRAKAAASSRNAAGGEEVSTLSGKDVNLDVNLGSDENRSNKDNSNTAHTEESKPSEAFEANLAKLEAAEAVPNGPNSQGEADEDSENEDEDEVLYRWWITEVVAEAREWMCCALLVFEVVFLFVLPCVGIFAAGNLPLGLLFLVLGVSTAVRHYFNARVFVMVRRSFSDSPVDDLEVEHTTALHSSDKAQKWRNHTRLHLILTRMNRHESKQRWVLIFGFIVMFTAVLFTASLMSEETSEQTTKYVKFAKDFSIPETVDTLAYPTCSLSSGVPPAISAFKGSLVDFSMLANIAYLNPVSDQAALDDWFGPGATTIQEEITANFKADFAARSPAQYKLITFNNVTFPELSKTAVVSIRGTVTTLDMFADMQLWMGASIFQVMRFLLPAGGAWTPILPDLIHYLGALEASNLDEVAYYKETTAFVNSIAADGRWPHIAVTGHSLGGGLAMVTGAQTGFPAIAMSGVNLVLSRKSFEPPLELDAINELTFNVVPDRDPIPRVDDLARMYQRISCRAPVNNIVDCHSSLRIACELQYTCGTNGRPVICACHRDYGYPAPEGNLTEFQQLCGIEEEASEDVNND